MSLVFEPLDPGRHARGDFSCGEESLDTYLQRQASQDQRNQLAACYVLHEQGSREIIGYYTLSALSITASELPPDLVAKLPRYEYLPATLLGRLAVDTKYQSQRMGERLIINA